MTTTTTTRITVAEFDRMIDRGIFDSHRERRIELIFGELREVNPPGPTHEVAIDRLTEWSYRLAPTAKVCIRIQNSIGSDEIDSAPQPDVAWVKKRDYTLRRPQAEDAFLIIEVANSSLIADRTEKASLYAAAGIADYWIANLCDFCVEVFRNPRKGQYRQVQSYEMGESVSPLAFPKIKLEVSEIFTGFPSA